MNFLKKFQKISKNILVIKTSIFTFGKQIYIHKIAYQKPYISYCKVEIQRFSEGGQFDKKSQKNHKKFYFSKYFGQNFFLENCIKKSLKDITMRG